MDTQGQRAAGEPLSLIVAVLRDRYGVTLARTSPTTVLWAADYIGEMLDYDTARMALREANEALDRAGRCVACPPYGTPLFSARFAPDGGA